MRTPLATYRLQLGPAFGFAEVETVAGYLRDLGITDIYASPIFRAAPGSGHGYDVLDPGEINPELGGAEGFETLSDRLGELGLGWVQDIVPNHAAFSGHNPFLADIFENGPDSPHYHTFDIDWEHPYESLRGRLLVPFLGGLYGECLDRGEIALEYCDAGFTVRYFDHVLPLAVESYATVLSARMNSLKFRLGEEDPAYTRYSGLVYTLGRLPTGEDKREERKAQVLFVKGMLRELYEGDDRVRGFVEENVRMFNGHAGSADKYRLLDTLLGEQHFRLGFWKVATEEINYRRFFNINGLISFRTEEDAVFDLTHGLVLKYVRAGRFTGLRVDHVDGLFDPGAYLERLSREAGDVYLAVEKILAHKETLPEEWKAEGATGYEFLNQVNGLLCDGRAKKEMSRVHASFTGMRGPYERLFREKKKLVIEKHMTGDVDNLAHTFRHILARDRYGSDITQYGLKRAIVEILASFHVYRTYVSGPSIKRHEREHILDAVDRARKSAPGFLYEINFMGRFLLLDFREHMSGEEKAEWTRAVMRFQQFSGPLMAKGFEDTLLYLYTRLLSLNEVGGSPERFGVPPAKFHEFNARRAASGPRAMNATATHDTKRGEDVRTRINVLAEMPSAWEGKVREWAAVNRKFRGRIGNTLVPDRNDEYFLYQTLVGTMPFGGPGAEDFHARLRDYVIKAVREAKVHTEWIAPDTDYEEAYLGFVDAVLSEGSPFLESFMPFFRTVSWYGMVKSLSQVLIKAASPGFPDFYQGTELWDFSLVDPDNRRPVDFELRRKYLEEFRSRGGDGGYLGEIMKTPEDGRVKMYLIWRALGVRQENRPAFEGGGYAPVEAVGEGVEGVVSFMRHGGGRTALVCAPRLVSGVCREREYPVGEAAWGETRLVLPEWAPARWTDAVTGEAVRTDEGGRLMVRDVLRVFPAALLVGEGRGAQGSSGVQ